jgi:hypothetical protein
MIHEVWEGFTVESMERGSFVGILWFDSLNFEFGLLIIGFGEENLRSWGGDL